MSGLLKGELAHDQARPFGSAGARTASLPPTAANPFAAYEQRIEQLEAELAAHEKTLPGLIADARREGRKEGLRERDEATAKKLALLEPALTGAVDRWTERLEALNGLSVQVAKTVLQKMTGNADWHGDFLAQAIAARLAVLDASSVIAVKLSAADISSQEIAELNASSKILIEASTELEAGQCTIALQMGEIELGPSAQWSEAARLLDSIAEQPC